VPLVDYHAEILKRQPGNAWDGTLVSKDGVHPSSGKNEVFDDENLAKCGYALRNFLNVGPQNVQARLHSGGLANGTIPGEDRHALPKHVPVRVCTPLFHSRGMRYCHHRATVA
jgi:hypothetical protein